MMLVREDPGVLNLTPAFVMQRLVDLKVHHTPSCRTVKCHDISSALQSNLVCFGFERLTSCLVLASTQNIHLLTGGRGSVPCLEDWLHVCGASPAGGKPCMKPSTFSCAPSTQ